MNKKQIVFTIMLLCLTNICTWFFSANEVYIAADVDKDGKESIKYPHFFNLHDAYYSERQYCACMIEMLHMYWQNYDVEYNKEGEVISRHNFFDDCIAETDAYLKADSINEGNWEDFFTEW